MSILYSLRNTSRYKAQFLHFGLTLDYVMGSQDHHWIGWFTGKTDRTQHIILFIAKIYYSKKIQSKINKGKRHMGKFRRNHGTSSMSLLLVESLRVCVISPALDCDNTWNVVYQGDSLETQSPEFLLRVGHLGTLCLTCTQISDSQKESRCSA